MRMNQYLAQTLKEEHVKEALRDAEQTRLVKMAQNTKRTQPFRLSALQHLRAWLNGGNNHIRSRINNL